MSWLRFGGLDRFSPFTRSPPQGSTTVSDADFSYITTEDLKRHTAETEVQQAPSTSDLGPPRDTDVLILKDKRHEYSTHFPAYSIAKGELRIKTVREAAAKKLNVDPKYLKLLYKGRGLKDDRLQCRAEGLRSGSEILCSTEDSDPNSFSDIGDSDTEEAGPEAGKRKRNRGKRSKKKSVRDDIQTPSTPSTQPRSPPSGISGTATPQTSKDKINALRATLQSFDQDIEAFLRHPPVDAGKRDFERKRLSETILTQVLLKTDAIESEGDPTARTSRKELVKDCQDVLKVIDDAHGGQHS